MSVEKEIDKLLEQAKELKDNNDVLSLTNEDLDLLSDEELKGLVENIDQLDEVSKATLAQYIGSVTDLKDTDNAAEETRKAKGKIDSKDGNENTNTAKVGDEAKDQTIKKEPSFSKGDNTQVAEAIDLGNLFEGHDLTEDFKEKATTIFESAVATRVAQELAMREEELVESVSKEMDELTEGLIDKVDGYLGYFAEQWLQNNELALDRGIKAELFESLMSGMQTLFSEHHINVPEEQLDVLESLQAEKEQLERSLNETTERNIALSNTLKDISKNMQIEEALEGLSDVQAEKFVQLAENIVFENEESFSKKLNVIRENYFKPEETKNKSVFMTDTPVESLNEEKEKPTYLSSEMARYVKSI